MRKRKSFVLNLFLIILIFGSTSGAQQQIPHHDAAAVIKLISVRVVDGEGRPVPGLHKEDFTLTDNGILQTISAFEVHALTESGMTLRPATQEETARTIAAMNRKIFIFLDLQGADERGTAAAKAAALRFIDTKVGPGDEIGIIGFSPMRSFFVQEYLTTDLNKIRKALRQAKELKPSQDESIKAGPDDEYGPRGPLPPAWRWVPDVYIDVAGTNVFEKKDFIARMSDLARILRFIPGNKSFFFFSGRNIGGAAPELGKEFASAGTPLYVVNTNSWIAETTHLTPQQESALENSPLKILAEASGGRYFSRIEDEDGIAGHVQSLTGNFYVLGYSVNEDWTGAYHKLKIGISKPDLRVFAQDGYYGSRPFAQRDDFEKESQLYELLFGDQPASELAPLVVESFMIFRGTEWETIFLTKIPVDPKSGVPPAKIEWYANLTDINDSPGTARKWEMDLASYNGRTLTVFSRERIPAGNYDYRLVIRDTTTGQAAVGRMKFQVPEKPSSTVVLSTPLLFEPGPEPRIINLLTPDQKKGAPAQWSFKDLYPFIPREHALVIREIEPGKRRLLAVIPTEIGPATPGNPPKIEISVEIFPTAGGETIFPEYRILEVKSDKAGREFMIVEISIPELRSGAYSLEFELRRADTGAKSTISELIVVK